MKSSDPVGLKEKYCTMYIVRHGESEANLNKIIAGHLDSPLTKAGEIQAKQVGIALKDIKFHAVYSSNLVRAKRTAEIAILERELHILTKRRLRERHFGKAEGKTYQAFNEAFQEVYKKLKNVTDRQRKRYKIAPDVESDEEMVSRFINILREIAIAHPSKTILVASHGGIMRAFLVHVGFASYSELHPGSIENTAYFKLVTDGVDFFVKETNGITKASTQT